MDQAINKHTIEDIIEYMVKSYEIKLPFYQVNKGMLEFTLMLEEYFNILFNPNIILGFDKKDIIDLVYILHLASRSFDKRV